MQTMRKIILLLMIIAVCGPWAIERLSIPEPYECNNGFRVDENFCGFPISGIQIFIMLFGSIFGSAFRLVVGDGNFYEFLLSLFIVWFIISPIISLLLFTARKDKPLGGEKGAHIGILSFAIMLGLFGIVRNMVELMWKLWGIWFYMLLLVSELTLELLKLGSRRKLHLAR